VGKVFIKTEKPIIVEQSNSLEEMGRFVLIKRGDIVAGGIIK